MIEYIEFKYTELDNKSHFYVGEQFDCELISDEDGIKTYETTTFKRNSKVIFSLMYVGVYYYLHHPSKPSWSFYEDGRWIHEFHEKGIRCFIEDLSCDGETKCMLALKYAHIGDGSYE